jgi:hypothetical protein
MNDSDRKSLLWEVGANRVLPEQVVLNVEHSDGG